MSSSTTEPIRPAAIGVSFIDDSLRIELTDGRIVSVPIGWFPRLTHASDAERNNWRFIGSGSGIHWPDLDEDISVENILAGKRSAESQASLKKWLDGRGSKSAA